MQLLLVLIFALVTSLLSTVVFYYGEPLAPGDFVAASDLPAAELRTPSFARTVERMPIYGEKLEAWLYMPLHVTKPPVIIMAPGLVLPHHSSYSLRPTPHPQHHLPTPVL